MVSSGRTLGFTSNLGGGWGEQVLAHGSMLHPIPDSVPDRVACLHEPVSIACHGLLRAPPTDGDPVLVVGAGIIGLASVAALKGLYPGCPVTVLARHPHQAEAAARGAGPTTWCGPSRTTPTTRSWPTWSAPGSSAASNTSC